MYLAVGKNYWQLHSTSWCLSGSSGMFYGRLKPSQRRQEASRWQTDATGREENRRKADPLPCLPGTGGQQSLLVLLSPQVGTQPTQLWGKETGDPNKGEHTTGGHEHRLFLPQAFKDLAMGVMDQGRSEYRENGTGTFLNDDRQTRGNIETYERKKNKK